MPVWRSLTYFARIYSSPPIYSHCQCLAPAWTTLISAVVYLPFSNSTCWEDSCQSFIVVSLNTVWNFTTPTQAILAFFVVFSFKLLYCDVPRKVLIGIYPARVSKRCLSLRVGIFINFGNFWSLALQLLLMPSFLTSMIPTTHCYRYFTISQMTTSIYLSINTYYLFKIIEI